jgi:hypothetical protein
MDGIANISSRMQQLDEQFTRGPEIDSAAFQAFMGKPPEAAKPPAPKMTPEQMLQSKSTFGFVPPTAVNPSAMGAPVAGALVVKPFAQSNSISCGQTSVAMCINAVTGKNLRDTDINNKYGFGLLNALNSESAEANVKWKDGGTISASQWDLIDHKVNEEKLPVIVALNGPEFSRSGHGHIVTVVKTEGDTVTIADPATGVLRTTTKQAMNNAPSHPDGNFIFYGTRGETAQTVAVAP